jgi:LPXTG-site transpeptidase (sortase) family protein
VDWEPPLFVVGQLRASAYVTQGNSVLVGHVRGTYGYTVFDHLDQLVPGDKVVASSRGETYDFVVSQIQVLPEDDTSPTESTVAPRLTLMTCAGTWNPLTRDYSDRLWVIAEPADP